MLKSSASRKYKHQLDHHIDQPNDKTSKELCIYAYLVDSYA